MKNYYETLGVKSTASQEEIKKAFHVLAHKHHPDKMGGNEAKFKECNEAYQTLSDPQKRSVYDRSQPRSMPFTRYDYAPPRDFYYEPPQTQKDFHQRMQENIDNLNQSMKKMNDLQKKNQSDLNENIRKAEQKMRHDFVTKNSIEFNFTSKIDPEKFKGFNYKIHFD